MDIKSHVREVLECIGEDPTREGLLETPARVEKMYKEIFSGYQVDTGSILKTFDQENSEGIVIVKNIEFYSSCEHHMVPFFGVAHIGYYPSDKIVGLSKLARLVDAYAKRLQVQERLTMQIREDLDRYLQTKGSAVIIEAKHMCMCMRGVSKQLSATVTDSYSGLFQDNAEERQKFLSLIKI